MEKQEVEMEMERKMETEMEFLSGSVKSLDWTTGLNQTTPFFFSVGKKPIAPELCQVSFLESVEVKGHVHI